MLSYWENFIDMERTYNFGISIFLSGIYLWLQGYLVNVKIEEKIKVKIFKTVTISNKNYMYLYMHMCVENMYVCLCMYVCMYVCMYTHVARISETKLIIKGFWTIVFIFIVIPTRFRLICPPAFFMCLSNSGTYT